MKVYVVTSGEYSDYGIEKVFLSKEKADIYCNLHNARSYSTCVVEEYETDDETIYTPMSYAEFSIDIDTSEVKISFYEVAKEDYGYIKNQTLINEYDNTLEFTRLLQDNYDREVMISKFTKICYDTRSLVLNELNNTEYFELMEKLEFNYDYGIKFQIYGIIKDINHRLFGI